MWMRGGGGPPSEAPPYKPEALAKQDEFKKRQNADDPMGHCLLVGVPRIYSMPMPFKIVQLPTEVIFLHEAFRGIRIVPTDKQQHPEDAEPEYLGTSVGKWDGDTLVVDVRNFKENSWLGFGATLHSDQLQVTERLTRVDSETIRYEATLTDPVVFTKPWTIHSTFTLHPDERIREYECSENNLNK
jgi:glucose/arabinose dehydrogenase